MKTLRAFLRGLFVFPFMLVVIIPGIVKSIFSPNWLPLALRMRRVWTNTAVWVLGVKVRKDAMPPPASGGPYIYAGNHRSYLDPVVTLLDMVALPVAKAEVSGWPIIGYAAKTTGVMWVQRENKSSRADAVKSMGEWLSKGYSVLVYPEGTTHSDPLTRPFRSGTFRLAAETGFPVVPVGIFYHDMADAWVGDDTFLPHFIRCFGKKRTLVDIAFGPPLKGGDPDELMEKTRQWIDDWLEGKNARSTGLNLTPN